MVFWWCIVVLLVRNSVDIIDGALVVYCCSLVRNIVDIIYGVLVVYCCGEAKKSKIKEYWKNSYLGLDKCYNYTLNGERLAL